MDCKKMHRKRNMVMNQIILKIKNTIKHNKKTKKDLIYNYDNILLENGITLISGKTILKGYEDNRSIRILYMGSYIEHNIQYFNFLYMYTLVGHSDYTRDEVEQFQFYKIKEDNDIIEYLKDRD